MSRSLLIWRIWGREILQVTQGFANSGRGQNVRTPIYDLIVKASIWELLWMLPQPARLTDKLPKAARGQNVRIAILHLIIKVWICKVLCDLPLSALAI